MLSGVRYVLAENTQNVYRIYTVVKYEILEDLKDSKLGLFWTFFNPMIQVVTYWFVFGFVLKRNEVDGIDYFSWLLGGMFPWFFINPCITEGCNAIYRKINIITKMKFPVSILPAVVIFKEAYNHVWLMGILLVFLVAKGHYPSLYWIGLIYYFIAAICFGIALSLTTSVLTMLARDVQKFIISMMRLLMYMTPIFWNIKSVPEVLQKLLKLNPIYYIITGYRNCLFYHVNLALHSWTTVTFWGWTILLFCIGSTIMYRFRTKFIDMI